MPVITAARILVADDFKDWRRTVRSIIQTRPELQVIAEAADGAEAVEKAEELHPDLILLDIGLPKLSGIKAATRILRVTPLSKILFLSQMRDPDVVEAALTDGGRGYVLKVDAAHDLLPALEAVLAGEKYISCGLRSELPMQHGLHAEIATQPQQS